MQAMFTALKTTNKKNPSPSAHSMVSCDPRRALFRVPAGRGTCYESGTPRKKNFNVGKLPLAKMPWAAPELSANGLAEICNR